MRSNRAPGVWLISFAVLVTSCTDQPLPTGESDVTVDRAVSTTGSSFITAAIDYTLTSFDLNTGTLSGASRLADVCTRFEPGDPCRFAFTAAITADTRLLAAVLDRNSPGDPYSPTDPYIPTDPCRTLAESYNVVATTDGLYSVIGAMAAQGCGARIILDAQTATIRRFQPVALPPNPI